MVDPDIFRILDSDRISVASQDFADPQVPHDNVGLVLDVEPDARKSCDSRAVRSAPNNMGSWNIQLPLAPMMDLLDPTRT